MKLVTTEFGQALQLLVMDELRPDHGLFMPDAIAAIVERYRFAKWPTDLTALAHGMKFEIGVVTLADTSIPIGNLDIYNDGIIVNVRNTNDADAVLDDFLEWSTAKFKLRQLQTPIPRKHASSVVVDFEFSIDRLIKDFDRIRRMVEGAYRNEDEQANFTVHAARLTLAADPSEAPPAQTTFIIEPRAGRPFVANRYFSNAPLSTNGHLKLLEAIETVLRS